MPTESTPITSNIKQRILVVEDDKSMNESLQRKLRECDFETEGCFDGEQALKLLNEKKYDGISLDIVMPVKDGFAVMAQRRGTPNEKTPIFVLSDIDAGDKRELAWSLGCVRFYRKDSNTPADVAKSIRDYLTSPQPSK